MEKFYQSLNIKYKLQNFFTNIYDEINNSDLIISRCGASSLAEIEFLKNFVYLFHSLPQQIIINIITLSNLKKITIVKSSINQTLMLISL